LANITGTTFTDSNLVNGVTCYYVVSAVNGGGEGKNSREASATPQALVTAYCTNLVTSAPQSWDANANWTNVANYPNGASVIANLTANIAAAQTNNLDQNTTIGWLNLGDANASSAFTLTPNGGTLNFISGANNNAGLVQLATSAGDVIVAPITLSNNLVVVNNATAHTLTLAGTISGSNTVMYVGPGSVTLTVSNGYTGATLINGGIVNLANDTANNYAFGTNIITLDQATLNLHSDNSTYNDYYWNLALPTNSTATLNGDGRCNLHGTLTGGGTLNYYAPYVRMELDGDWSAFAGQINASGSDFRFNNANGLPKAALSLNGNTAYSLGGSLTVGELSGLASAYLNSTAWTVGGRNTSATFAGIILGNSIVKTGTGTWTLSGNNTYTGPTTINGGALQIGNGGNTGTLGTGNVTDNAALIFNRYDNVVCTNVISGAGSLTQAGFGVLTLTAADTYSGATFISAGTLALTNTATIANTTNINLENGGIFDVIGTASHNLTLGSGKLISGDGTVNGNFTLASGALLIPGNNDLGTLNFNNALTLNTGSKTLLTVSQDAQTNSQVTVGGTLTVGGMLVITNADDPLSGGDSFKLFTATNYTGSFSTIVLPALTPGLYWNTATLKLDGTVHIMAETSPVVGAVTAAGGRLVVIGTGGITNGSYYLIGTTNLLTPMTNWLRLATNPFDGNGNFSFTNNLDAGGARWFFSLQLP